MGLLAGLLVVQDLSFGHMFKHWKASTWRADGKLWLAVDCPSCPLTLNLHTEKNADMDTDLPLAPVSRAEVRKSRKAGIG